VIQGGGLQKEFKINFSGKAHPNSAKETERERTKNGKKLKKGFLQKILSKQYQIVWGGGS